MNPDTSRWAISSWRLTNAQEQSATSMTDDDMFFEAYADLLRLSRRHFLIILTEFNRAVKFGFKRFSGGGALEAWFLLMELDQAQNGSLNKWEAEQIALPGKGEAGTALEIRGNAKGLCERDLAEQDRKSGVIMITDPGRELAKRIYGHWMEELPATFTPRDMRELAKKQFAFFMDKLNELALVGDYIPTKRAIQLWYILSEIVCKSRTGAPPYDNWLYVAPYDEVERAISRGFRAVGEEIEGVPETGRGYIAELKTRGFIITGTGTVSLTPRARVLIEDTVTNYIGLVSPFR